MTYKPTPMYVAVDVIPSVWRYNKSVVHKSNQVLLIRRKDNGKLALPGGFVEPNETAEEAAVKELLEETNIKFDPNDLELALVMSDPKRDPRQRTISLVYIANVSDLNEFTVKAGDDARSIVYMSPEDVEATDPSEFAFDHRQILDIWQWRI